jgi:hypothetical protein
MEITSLLNLVGWSIIIIGQSIGWWISKKEQKDIETATEFLHQSLKTGDHILIAEAQSKSNDLFNKRIGIGGSHSVRMAGWLIAMGVFFSNILIFVNKF